MKKVLLFAMLLLPQFMTALADNGRRPMLEQNKRWYYIYHHFEENLEAPDSYDHTTWMVCYYLRGDTVIDDTKYMKMYRMEFYESGQTKSDSYFAAYRENEEGKVYVRNKEEGANELLWLDLSLKFEEEDFGFKQAEPVKETIKVDAFGIQDFCRYR